MISVTNRKRIIQSLKTLADEIDSLSYLTCAKNMRLVASVMGDILESDMKIAAELGLVDDQSR